MKAMQEAMDVLSKASRSGQRRRRRRFEHGVVWNVFEGFVHILNVIVVSSALELGR